MKPGNADFAIRIDFARGAGNPSRIFASAAQLIKSFEALDRTMAGSISVTLAPVLVLEDIEVSSLKIWLRTLIREVDDDALKDMDIKKQLGKYLVKGKYAALEWLDREIDKDGAPRIEELRDTLQQNAQATGIRHLPDYPPPHEGKLIEALDGIQVGKAMLDDRDKLYIETDEGNLYEVDLGSTWIPSDAVEPVEGVRSITTSAEMILTVRKPDFLGTSQWDFRHGKNKLSAPITDTRWLEDFLNRAVPVLPGDALRCEVTFDHEYDTAGELLSTHIEISKVFEVINAPPPPKDMFEAQNP